MKDVLQTKQKLRTWYSKAHYSFACKKCLYLFPIFEILGLEFARILLFAKEAWPIQTTIVSGTHTTSHKIIEAREDSSENGNKRSPINKRKNWKENNRHLQRKGQIFVAGYNMELGGQAGCRSWMLFTSQWLGYSENLVETRNATQAQ